MIKIYQKSKLLFKTIVCDNSDYYDYIESVLENTELILQTILNKLCEYNDNLNDSLSKPVIGNSVLISCVSYTIILPIILLENISSEIDRVV